MTYPFDQLSALAKANFDLSLSLANIARQGSQGSLRAVATLATTFGEAMRPETSPEKKAAALSERNAGLFRDAEKIRQQLVADTQAAFETWREAWSYAIVPPDDAKAAETFGDMVRFWQNLGTITPPASKAG